MRDYGDFCVSEYPELRDYLKNKLSELGQVEIVDHRAFGILKDHCEAHIHFAELPVVYDWRVSWPDGVMFLNIVGGGCFITPMIATVRLEPKPGSDYAEFDFELALDSRDVPLEQHDPAIVKRTIDDFVEKCKVGFCYFFPK